VNAGGGLPAHPGKRHEEGDRLVPRRVVEPVEIRVIPELREDLLDAGPLRVGEPAGTDGLDHVVGRCVAHLLPGPKALA
jgi:hypothetical protein